MCVRAFGADRGVGTFEDERKRKYKLKQKLLPHWRLERRKTRKKGERQNRPKQEKGTGMGFSLHGQQQIHTPTHTHNTTCLPFLPHPPPPHLKPLLLPSHTLTPCSPVVPIAFHLSVSLHPRPLSCIIDHSRARERMKGQESVKLR